MVSAQNVWVREHEPARLLISEEKLEREVGFLSDSLCQGRGTGTGGGAAAAFWIHKQFERAGLLKFDDTYAKKVWISKDMIGHNIVGMIPGSHKKKCDRYIVVGAHYDHIGQLNRITYPGADANASGTVALTSLAEMFSMMKTLGRSYNSNIIFVAFDAREMSMAGSNAFWKMIENGELTDPVSGKVIKPSNIKLMVNIDQLGCTLSPLKSGREDYMIMLGNHSLKPAERELLSYCNRSTGLHMDIDYTYYGSKNFTEVFYRLSDQRVFIDNNIPAVLFTSGITMNTNRTRDTADTLDYPVFKKRIYLIFEWLEKML
jgi:Zn-dependent M28 family amino/carboxypeptidase